ncbi:hypothetical protein HN388_00100 [bacterium]|jgi:hypothetical protein|nr:hypothetical protein [bacterium]
MCLAVIFMSMTNQAQAEPAMPLEVGNSWSYETDTGNSLTITIAETFTVMGRMTYHLEYDTGSGYIFYNEYLSWNELGQLQLHARKGHPTQDPVVFDPPMVWFAPENLGDIAGHVSVYADFEGNNLLHEADYLSHFVGEETVNTPAGNFNAFHVEELNFAGDARWYAEGIGMVQLTYLNGGPDIYRLVSSNINVANENTSWSRMKALYR